MITHYNQKNYHNKNLVSYLIKNKFLFQLHINGPRWSTQNDCKQIHGHWLANQRDSKTIRIRKDGKTCSSRQNRHNWVKRKDY